MKDDKLYHFVESWKHSFTYRKGDTLYTIQGDTYRDEFNPTIDEEHMDYFKDKSVGDNWVVETPLPDARFPKLKLLKG